MLIVTLQESEERHQLELEQNELELQQKATELQQKTSELHTNRLLLVKVQEELQQLQVCFKL